MKLLLSINQLAWGIFDISFSYFYLEGSELLSINNFILDLKFSSPHTPEIW
jgi:hypothetical protein